MIGIISKFLSVDGDRTFIRIKTQKRFGECGLSGCDRPGDADDLTAFGLKVQVINDLFLIIFISEAQVLD
jgi:hypothetical protein